MNRSPARSHLSSSSKPSFLFLKLFLFLFYFGLSSLYTIHTFIQILLIIFPLPPGGLKKKFFFNIQGRQVAGESSDLLGCVCVCCVCVCRLVVPFHFLCLSSLSIYSLSPSVHNYSLFLSLQEQHWWKRWAVSPSIHPHLIHSLVIQLLFFSFSLYVLILWTDSTIGKFPSSLSYNCLIGDLHWTSLGLFNYRDCLFFIVSCDFSWYFFLL